MKEAHVGRLWADKASDDMMEYVVVRMVDC